MKPQTARRFKAPLSSNRDWIRTFRDDARTEEAWACRGCQTIDNQRTHEQGPDYGLCRCDGGRLVSAPSEAYRARFDTIRWG